MRRAAGLLALLLLAAPAAGVPERDAWSTHPAVSEAWHEPALVRPGEQWRGYLQLKPGFDYARVGYQVCNAGDGFCFAPTHDAQALGNGTYRFDTSDYLAGGRPVDWQPGWRVGVRWFLADEDRPDSNGTWVPRAPPSPTEEVPIEDLYLTFDIPGEPARGAPAPAFLLLAFAVLGAAALRRRG